MKSTGRLFGGLLLMTAIAGCADGPQPIVHDLVVFWNEVCDNTLKATDEETAKKLLEVEFKLLDAKCDALKARCQKVITNYDKDDAIGLENALMDYKIEIEAVEKRLLNARERIEKIRAAAPSPDDTPNLKKIMTWPDTRKTFHQYDYGKYMPNLRVRKDQEANIIPKQLARGLVPARPNIELKKPKEKDK